MPKISKLTHPMCYELGYRRTESNTKDGTTYPHGLGCAEWDNCFTCPYPECLYVTFSKDKIKKEKYAKTINVPIQLPLLHNN